MSLWARMAEEGRKGGRVSVTGAEEIVIYSAKVN
jgi:hypothetical protein